MPNGAGSVGCLQWTLLPAKKSAPFLIAGGYQCFQNGFISQGPIPVAVCAASFCQWCSEAGTRRAAGTAALLLAAGSAPPAEPAGRVVQDECRPNSISHSPKNGLSTYDGQPLHSSSTFEVRTMYHIFSMATFIGWLAAERTSDGLRLKVELAGDMCLYKRNGIGRLLFHSSSEWETVLW